MDFHSLSVLEYDKIRYLLSERSVSSLGREACQGICPLDDPELIQKSLDQISELKILLPTIEPFLQEIADPRLLLEQVKTEGATLDPAELNLILRILETSRKIRGAIKEGKHPVLSEVGREIIPCADIEKAITKAISPDHEILDRASPELRRVRKTMAGCRKEINTTLNKILKDCKDSIQEDVITIRDSRYVINVKSSKQKRVGGIVHGVSASALSVFLEPLKVVDLNNRLVELKEEETKEIERILAAITRLICENLENLKRTISALSLLDYIYAKTRFSIDYDCNPSEPNTRAYLHIRNGRHPLLKDPVPLTVEIGEDWTTILLSGPNTGGKTVALKTVGLLTLMAQSGMEIPADAGSTVGIFREVFADIGDQQSIEENLSTFSSHMNQIIKILRKSNERSLVLLDELGVGTDPSQGEALGMAVLQGLTERGARVLATSHYANLKVWVHSQERMRNAAMLFDTETLEPTYRLKLGLPGASYGLEIARRIGMDERDLERAKKFVSASNLKVDQLIEELERMNLRAMEKEELLRVQENRLSELVTEYADRLSDVRKEAKALLKKAKEEALAILEDTRKLAERLVKEIRERDKRAIKEVRKALEREMTTLVETPKSSPDVKPFDTVYIRSLHSSGTVTEVAGRLARIDTGKFKVTVPISELEK
jgi:DNA mismatch repair protein MutS2